MRHALFALVLAACAPPSSPPRAIEPGPKEAFADATHALRVVEPKLPALNLVQRSDGNMASYVEFRGGRSVVFDPGECETAQAVFGYAAVFGVFGHEIGHALDSAELGHMTHSEAQLSADAWAGCALSIRGFETEPYTSLIAAHEPQNVALRAEATEQGYRSCSQIW